MASHIHSTHKGHGFRYAQADNKCYLTAGVAICIEFKVSIDLSRTSEFFFQIANCHMVTLPHGNIATQTLCSNLDKCSHLRSSCGVQMYV